MPRAKNKLRKLLHELNNVEKLSLSIFLAAHPAGIGHDRLILDSNSCGIGVVSTVECECGAKKDITDYDCW